MTFADKSQYTPDLGLIIGLTTLVGGLVYFLRDILKSTINPGVGFGIEGIVFNIITLLFVAVFISCIFSLIGKVICTLGNLREGFWVQMSSEMINFAVYILLLWILGWGSSTALALILYHSTKPFVGKFAALFFGLIVAIPCLILIFRSIPKTGFIGKSPRRLIGIIGKWKFFFLIIFSLLMSIYFINNAYTFEASTSEKIYRKTDILQIDVTLKGRILNHDKLTGRIYRNNTEDNAVVANSLSFIENSPGEYINWTDLNNFAPGVYRIELYFKNFEQASRYNKFLLVYISNNSRKRSLIFRLIP